MSMAEFAFSGYDARKGANDEDRNVSRVPSDDAAKFRGRTAKSKTSGAPKVDERSSTPKTAERDEVGGRISSRQAKRFVGKMTASGW